MSQSNSIGLNLPKLTTASGSELGSACGRPQCAQQPFRLRTWIAALSVIVDPDGGDLARSRRLGPVRFEHALRPQITRRGGQRPCLRIVIKLFAALTDPFEPAGPMKRMKPPPLAAPSFCPRPLCCKPPQ